MHTLSKLVTSRKYLKFNSTDRRLIKSDESQRLVATNQHCWIDLTIASWNGRQHASSDTKLSKLYNA